MPGEANVKSGLIRRRKLKPSIFSSSRNGKYSEAHFIGGAFTPGYIARWQVFERR
jgi:hypothetical protein